MAATSLNVVKLLASRQGSRASGYSKDELRKLKDVVQASCPKSSTKAVMVSAILATLTEPRRTIPLLTERQNHGRKYEQKIITEFGMTAAKSATEKWDAYHDNHPVQIKYAHVSKKIAEMADYFRQKQLVEKDFVLVLGYYSDKVTHEELVERRRIYLITKEEWLPLFDCPFGFDERLRTDLASITNAASDNQRWTKMRTDWKAAWGLSRPVKLAPKRDSKAQKRIQCTIALDALDQFARYSLSKLIDVQDVATHSK